MVEFVCSKISSQLPSEMGRLQTISVFLNLDTCRQAFSQACIVANRLLLPLQPEKETKEKREWGKIFQMHFLSRFFFN